MIHDGGCVDEPPVSPVHRVVRAAVLVVVVAASVALVVGVIVRQERWQPQPILGVIVTNGIDGRTLQVQIESCGQDDRVDIVSEDGDTIVLEAESQGTPDGDCADGVATACTADLIGTRQVVDDATGDDVDVQVDPRRDLPACE